MLQLISLFSALSITWFFLSAQEGSFFLIAGLASVLFAIYIYQFLGFSPTKARVLKLSHIKFLFWIFKEIIKASFTLSKEIFSKNPEIQESVKVIKLDVEQEESSAELISAIYANSITLTPGTITLDVKDFKLLVHSLNEGNIQDLETNRMFKMVEKNV